MPNQVPDTINDGEIFSMVMADRDFARLSEFIHAAFGIKLPRAKKTMLEGRLRKRLRTLGMKSFKEYCDFLFAPGGMETECIQMVDLVTTNKTDFFRESAHFDHLTNRVLPELVDVYGLGSRTRLNVWSAGCSTGEEPYTLAIVLNEYAEKDHRFHDYSILATDISTRVLDKARKGIYEHDRIQPVPMYLRRKYLLRSKDRSKDLVRIAPELRARISFHRLNFMDDDYGILEPMSIIFCRNVLIYFDRPTQQRVIGRFCRNLIPGGYLFTGHSETLHGMDLPLTAIATTVYKRI